MSKRKAIPSETKLKLFSDASGYCQNPSCLECLFPPDKGGKMHIAEMAHIIPHGQQGPRSDERMSSEYDTESYENLILLCPNCHTIIDKDSASYPRHVLLEWKENHLSRLLESQGVVRYQDRSSARSKIVEILSENKVIWKRFAPIDGDDFLFDPESEKAQLWNSRIRSVIIPNSYKLINIVNLNLSLLNEGEFEVYSEFKEHVRGFVERHFSDVSGRAIRFPEGMEGLFL